MKFVLYGNGQQSHCSEVHYKRSLESLGHTCEILQENRVRTEVVLREALKADALIWVHSHGFKNLGRLPMDTVLARLKDAGVPSIAMHLDLYLPINRWQQYEHSPYFKTEYWFAVDQPMVELMDERGWTKAHFIPAGVLEDECYISTEPSEHANDVVFVGAKGYHREWPWRGDLIALLRKTYGRRFTHVGGDGDTGTLRGDALNRMYANSKVAVGDTLCVGFDYPWYHSDRLWEASGRGAAQVFPHITGLDTWFKDGEHLRYFKFGDFADLRAKIDWMLDHPEEREQIRRGGHEMVKTTGTYRHRWQTIIETVFGA